MKALFAKPRLVGEQSRGWRRHEHDEGEEDDFSEEEEDDFIASDAMRLVGGNPASGEFCRGTAISVFGEFTAQGKVFVADLSGIGHRHW